MELIYAHSWPVRIEVVGRELMVVQTLRFEGASITARFHLESWLKAKTSQKTHPEVNAR